MNWRLFPHCIMSIVLIVTVPSLMCTTWRTGNGCNSSHWTTCKFGFHLLFTFKLESHQPLIELCFRRRLQLKFLLLFASFWRFLHQGRGRKSESVGMSENPISLKDRVIYWGYSRGTVLLLLLLRDALGLLYFAGHYRVIGRAQGRRDGWQRRD